MTLHCTKPTTGLLSGVKWVTSCRLIHSLLFVHPSGLLWSVSWVPAAAEAPGMSHSLSLWTRDRDNRGVSGEQYDTIFDVTSSLLSCLWFVLLLSSGGCFLPQGFLVLLQCHLRLTRCTKYILNIWLIWFIQMILSLPVSTHCLPAPSCSSAWFAAIYYTSGGLTVSFYGLLPFRHASLQLGKCHCYTSSNLFVWGSRFLLSPFHVLLLLCFRCKTVLTPWVQMEHKLSVICNRGMILTKLFNKTC